MKENRIFIEVDNPMQSGYRYELVYREGTNFDKDFKPDLTPKEMLNLGVFGGMYLNSAKEEYPVNWFEKAKLSEGGYDKSCNFFNVKASQSISVWKEKGWISEHDPRGWLEWYCRYYRGRRIPKEDERQIKRWKAMTRHMAQVRKNCRAGDLFCRPKQRQALLHWAYDSRKM